MTDDNPSDRRYSIISLSSATIIKVLALIALALLIYLIRDIVILVFAALILAMALDSWVSWLQRWRIPRVLSVLIIFSLVFLVSALTIILLIPPVYDQISDLITNFPQYYDAVTRVLENVNFPGELSLKEQIAALLGKLSEFFGKAASGVLSTLLMVSGGLISLVAFLVMTIYFVSSAPQTTAFFVQVAPQRYQGYIQELIPRLQAKLGFWLRGQLILCLTIFVMTFIALSIIGVHYAFLLALLAGIFEVLPFVGPINFSHPRPVFRLGAITGKGVINPDCLSPHTAIGRPSSGTQGHGQTSGLEPGCGHHLFADRGETSRYTGGAVGRTGGRRPLDRFH